MTSTHLEVTGIPYLLQVLLLGFYKACANLKKFEEGFCFSYKRSKGKIVFSVCFAAVVLEARRSCVYPKQLERHLSCFPRELLSIGYAFNLSFLPLLRASVILGYMYMWYDLVGYILDLEILPLYIN